MATRTTTSTAARGRTTSPAHQANLQPPGTAADARTLRRNAVMALRETGMPQQTIAQKLGVSVGTIRNDLRG